MEKEQRQFKILKALAAEDYVPGQKLSDAFGVSLRTIYRDIEELVANGVTIEGSKGIEGGYRVRIELKDIVNNIETFDSLRKVFNNSSNFKQIKHKSSFYSLPSTKCIIDQSILIPYAQANGSFEQICNALNLNRAIQLILEKTGTELVMPLGLYFTVGEWFLVKSDLDQNISNIAVSRLDSVNTTELSFRPPREFKLAEYLLDAEFNGDIIKEVVLRFENNHDELTARMLGKFEYDEKEGIFRIDSIGLDFAVRWLISLGTEVTVEKPEILKVKLREYAEDIFQKYK